MCCLQPEFVFECRSQSLQSVVGHVDHEVIFAGGKRLRIDNVSPADFVSVAKKSAHRHRNAHQNVDVVAIQITVVDLSGELRRPDGNHIGQGLNWQYVRTHNRLGLCHHANKMRDGIPKGVLPGLFPVMRYYLDGEWGDSGNNDQDDSAGEKGGF